MLGRRFLVRRRRVIQGNLETQPKSLGDDAGPVSFNALGILRLQELAAHFHMLSLNIVSIESSTLRTIENLKDRVEPVLINQSAFHREHRS